MALFPDIYVPSFAIRVGGRPLDEKVAKSILEVSVTEHLNPPSEFSFRLNDPTMEFVRSAGGQFSEGMRVEISIGYIGKARKMIVGEITALSADFPGSGPVTLQVEGFDMLHAMTRGTIYRQFPEGVSDGDIVSQIASEMGLRPSVDSTPKRTEPRVQDHQTNLKFLGGLAEANGYFFWEDGDTLNFRAERPEPDAILLKWGETLVSFYPRLSTTGQVNVVEVRGWDPVQKQDISARVERSGVEAARLSPTGRQQLARGAGGRSERVIFDPGVSSVQQAEARANGILRAQQEALFRGSGTSVGDPRIRVGSVLQLSGIGRFSKDYVVERVTHSVGESGYQTSFEVVIKKS